MRTCAIEIQIAIIRLTESPERVIFINDGCRPSEMNRIIEYIVIGLRPMFAYIALSGLLYTISIIVTQGDCELNMPNAFTPNNDGVNDVFRVKYPQFIKLFHMKVFNRFGAKVFETYDVNNGWSGKLNSIDQPIEIYVWTISVTNNDGIAQTYKGTITLIR